MRRGIKGKEGRKRHAFEVVCRSTSSIVYTSSDENFGLMSFPLSFFLPTKSNIDPLWDLGFFLAQQLYLGPSFELLYATNRLE